MRVVQLSDTHLAAAEGVPESVAVLLEWVAAEPPDLVVVTGDIVHVDPDDEADRAFAREVIGSLDCPWVAIPGNHDVGFFDEPDRFAARVATFVDTWGSDSFAVAADGWQLVGLDAYNAASEPLPEPVATALAGSDPVAAFIHQPVDAEPVDGWELPDVVRERIAALLADAPVRLVGSGHRHCAVVRDQPGGGVAGDAIHVWAPSTTIPGQEAYHGGDPGVGAVEYGFAPDGTFTHRFVAAS